jgi:DmsE family decaheme c-type cytochrome
VRKDRAAPSFLQSVLSASLLFSVAAAGLAQTPTPKPSPAATATPAPKAAPTPAPSAATTPAPAEASAAASELPKCADCHTDLAAAWAKNPHARYSGRGQKPDPEEMCSTCHGDGTKHIESGGDVSFIRTPKGLTGSEDCLACHDSVKAFSTGGQDSFSKGTQDSFTHGVHANSAAVNCLTCHSIHHSAPKSTALISSAPGPLCATCHTTQTASFQNKPYAHRLDRGGMTCLDCHSPHAQRGQAVKMTTQGELPCMNCHSEMRGPFVFDHVTGSGGTCLSCHEPHGSNNPKMLLWARVDQLCLSCHSQTGGPPTFGSQPPSFHDLTLPRYRNCTTCHVAVHGSNLSPQLLK